MAHWTTNVDLPEVEAARILRMSPNEDGTPQVFEYVNFQGPNPDAHSRKRVRAQAMKDYRRRQASASEGFVIRKPAKMHDIPTKGSTQESDDQMGMKTPAIELLYSYRTRSYNNPTCFEPSHQSSRQSSKTRIRDDQEEDIHSQLPAPGHNAKKDSFAVPWAGRFDPFDTLPVASTKHVHKMMYHCKLMQSSWTLSSSLPSSKERRKYCCSSFISIRTILPFVDIETSTWA